MFKNFFSAFIFIPIAAMLLAFTAVDVRAETNPDLIITDVSYTTSVRTIDDKKYNLITFTIKYKNNSDVDIITPFYISQSSGYTDDYPYENGFTASDYVNASLSPIKANTEYTLLSGDYVLAYGKSLNKEFKFYIDSYIPFGDANDNLITESNEDNNTFTKTITVNNVSSEKPDLIIREGSLKTYVENGIIWADLETEDKNQINSDVDTWLLSASSGGKSEYYAGSGLSTYVKKHKINLGFVGVKADGNSYSVTFTIDPQNIIDEADENNNTFTKTITVGSAEKKYVELFPKSITAGLGGVYVEFANLGPDEASEGFAVTLTEADGKPLYGGQSVLSNDFPVGEVIASGESTKSFFSIGASQGTYEITAKIDADNDIIEGDEDNNTLKRYMTVGSNNSIVISEIPTNNLKVTNYHQQSLPPLPNGYNEWVVVDASKHSVKAPAQTKNKYSGIVEVEMDGIIQSSGTSLSDAYYILTDYNDNAVAPVKANEFGLYVNGRRVQNFYPQAYVNGSQYQFRLALGNTPTTISFSIGDLYTSDNAGAFKIALKGTITDPVKTTEDSQPVRIDADLPSATDPDDRLVLKLERALSQLEQKVVDLEKRLVEKIDRALSKKVAGRILLQVEENGEAWYVDPNSENKFYMKDGEASYDIMRSLGLGISNANLEKIPIGIQEKIYTLKDSDSDGIPDNLEVALGTDPNKADSDGDGYDDKTEILNGYRPDKEGKLNTDKKLIDRLRGRIVLQVESHGEAWYINPSDGRRYYLGDGATAYNVMRFLSLGIKNDDLRKIQVGEYGE